ncbi:MAG TPA: BatD family protein [Bacteroidota bacterium]|nr:BatD family protein [Bacteroidota bacterium]
MMTRFVISLSAALIFLLPQRVAAEDVSFTASLDKSTVSMGEQFTLELNLTGAGMSGGSNLSLPDLSKFMVLSGPNQSSSVQIINGSVSSSVSYSYVLQPREIGKFTIGPASIQVDGKKYATQSVDLTVVKGSAKPNQPATAQASGNQVDVGDNLFIRATVDRSRIYLGEQVTATFKIYTRVQIVNASFSKMPTWTGFWEEDLSSPQQLNYVAETYNGKQYRVSVVKKVALFATQPGTLEINPLEIVCQVQMQSRKRSNDWFDQFFNDPFSGSFSTSNVTIKSLPEKITVLPLPKNNVPPWFKGAVGKFNLSATISSTTVKTNEPLSLKATIAGTGNIKILEAPNLEVPSEFEKYDPKVNETIDRSGNLINGSKTFEWLLVPRYPGQKKIEPLEFSYFDPSRGKYVTLHSDAFNLDVEKGSAEAPQIVSGISKQDVQLLSQDIRFIKTGSTTFRKKGGENFPMSTVAFATMIPLLAFVGLVAYRQKTLKELSDVASFRSRKAIKIATKRLKQAQALLASPSAEAFYAEISRALWAYLSDKLAIDRAELSIDYVMKQLEGKPVSQEVVTRLKECLEACEFARFAPSSSQQEEKSKIYTLAADVIISTEKELSK